MLRLFIAIKFSNDPLLVDFSKNLQSKLSRSNIKWVEDKNLHLTLQFLGNAEDYNVNSICEYLSKIAGNHTRFSLQYTLPGYFGKSSSPKVIWFGLKQHPTVQGLQKDIENSMKELGFMPDEKKFFPHITLGRVKHLEEVEVFQNEMMKKTNVRRQVFISEFCLFSSVLQKEKSGIRNTTQVYFG